MPKKKDAQRRMPVRTATVELAGDFEGWTATMRVNPKMRTLDDLRSGDDVRLRAAVASLVVDWNFVDEEGEPLPAARDGGIDECTDELLGELIDAYGRKIEELAALPKN